MLELNQKVFELTSSVDLTGEKEIRVIVNDEDRGIKLQEIFRKIEFEEGKITGHSILEFYNVKDGMLTDKEGNSIYLATDKYPQILFKKIRDPWGFIADEITVNAPYVRDIGLLLKLVKTEETITGLSAADKKMLIEEREMTEAEAAKQSEAEKAAAEAAEVERIKLEEEERKAVEEAKAIEEAAQKAEEDAKAAEAAKLEEESARIKAEEDAIEASKKAEADKIQAEKDAITNKKKEMEESEFFLNAQQYKSAQVKYARLGFIEYPKDGYHFFYGESDDEDNYPFILAEREYGFYEQLPGGIVDENEKTAEYEFTEGEQDKLLILNIAKGTFIITDQEAEA